MNEKQPIIPPINKDLLMSELTNDKLFRKSNFGNTEIYLATHEDSPNLLNEIGRLREISFREAGGGTGKSYDIDYYDTSDKPYSQLVLWNPDEQEIIGGYRFVYAKNILDTYEKHLATSKLFTFSDTFIQDFLPYTIELGRSFVQPKYQPNVNSRRGMFALDNLWDGLGALIVEYSNAKYFFGKVTMYKHYSVESRDTLLSFLKLYFDDKDKMVVGKNPIAIDYKKYHNQFSGNNYKNDYQKLIKLLKAANEKIPPLVNAYMNLSTSMLCFDTVENHSFGGVEETAILINIGDIHNTKKERHINSYQKNPELTGLR